MFYIISYVVVGILMVFGGLTAKAALDEPINLDRVEPDAIGAGCIVILLWPLVLLCALAAGTIFGLIHLSNHLGKLLKDALK